MKEEQVISVNNISKKFTKNIKRTMINGSKDVAKSLIGIKPDTTTLRKGEFWSVQNVSFNLNKGETLGLIGNNGSGKTTLLRILNGIFPPDSGVVNVKGRIGALIAVGAGFHPHLTGRENIFLNGTILGMSKKEITSKMSSIIEFAEIGDFIDAPVSTYSSGMNVRLGFSIAIHSDIDILLADEVLAVGDIGFQLKCFNKIGELRKQGVATILVAHNMHAISTFCTSVLVMNKGIGKYYDDVEEGITAYKSMFLSSVDTQGEIEKVNTGTEKFKILNTNIHNLVDDSIEICSKEAITVEIDYESNLEEEIEIDLLIYLPIPYSVPYFQATNKSFKKKLEVKKGKGKIKFTIKDINLNNFKGYLSIAIWRDERTELLFWWRNIPVKVNGNILQTGWTSYDVEYILQ